MLNSARGSNGFGVNTLSYTEIKAYYDLNCITAQPWEIEVLRYFDNTVMQVYADRAKAESKKQTKK